MRIIRGLTTGERILLDVIKEKTGRDCFVCMTCGEVFYGYSKRNSNGDCCNSCYEQKGV